MRRVAWILASALILLLLGWAGLYGASEIRLRSYAEPPGFSAPIPTDSASLARGGHLTRTRGCFGCHGQRLEGSVFEEEWPWVRRAVAPNLAQSARKHPPQTMANAIRGGVGPDGRALWSMPSYNFRHLSDQDVAAIIGFLRSAEVVEQALPRPSLGWKARWWLATGQEPHMATWVAAVPKRVLAADAEPVLIRGEQLAMTTCNECHGLDLRGAWDQIDIAPPDLAIAATYSWEDFQTLMKTGVPRDGRDLGLMTIVARDRFAYFTSEELEELYAFLQTLPSRPVPQGVIWRPER